MKQANLFEAFWESIQWQTNYVKYGKNWIFSPKFPLSDSYESEKLGLSTFLNRSIMDPLGTLSFEKIFSTEINLLWVVALSSNNTLMPPLSALE